MVHIDRRTNGRHVKYFFGIRSLKGTISLVGRIIQHCTSLLLWTHSCLAWTYMYQWIHHIIHQRRRTHQYFGQQKQPEMSTPQIQCNLYQIMSNSHKNMAGTYLCPDYKTWPLNDKATIDISTIVFSYIYQHYVYGLVQNIRRLVTI